MSKPKKPLTGRERLFCQLYALLGNPREAAVWAGYAAGKSSRTAAQLLDRSDIRKQVGKCASRRVGDLSDLAVNGLIRLAFGSHADGARLALEELESQLLDNADLFCVAEVKRPKGGGCEVKFYDRLPVLELLLRTAQEEGSSTGPGGLLEALQKSAAPAAGGDDPLAV